MRHWGEGVGQPQLGGELCRVPVVVWFMSLAIPLLGFPPPRGRELAFAKRLVEHHGLGLAPGVAFGDEGEGWLRWCFASRDPLRLDVGVQRLARAMAL